MKPVHPLRALQPICLLRAAGPAALELILIDRLVERIGQMCLQHPLLSMPPPFSTRTHSSHPHVCRWRVQNLFVYIYQLAPQYGVSQPYQVMEVYRY